MLPMLYDVCPARQRNIHMESMIGEGQEIMFLAQNWLKLLAILAGHPQPTQNLSLRKTLEVIHPLSTQGRTSLCWLCYWRSPHKLRHFFVFWNFLCVQACLQTQSLPLTYKTLLSSIHLNKRDLLQPRGSTHWQRPEPAFPSPALFSPMCAMNFLFLSSRPDVFPL